VGNVYYIDEYRKPKGRWIQVHPRPLPDRIDSANTRLERVVHTIDTITDDIRSHLNREVTPWLK